MHEHKHKVNRPERRKAKREARKLLQSPRFFHQLLLALKRMV
jgi:hypothetical protein